MRKAMRKWYLRRNVVHFHHRKGTQIFSKWRPKNFEKQTKRVNRLFTNQIWASNVKDEFRQHKYVYWMAAWKSSTNIYRKAVDRELWRRNVLNTIIFPKWRPGTSRMTELTQIYVPNDGQEFWGQTALPNTFYSRNEYRERKAGRRRGNTNI